MNKPQKQGQQVQRKEQECTLSLAKKLGVSPQHVKNVVKQRVLGDDGTDSDLAMVMMTADRYDLNPMMGELYAVKTKGGLQIATGIDGFLKIANRHPQYNGHAVEFTHDDEGNLISCRVTVYRKDREHASSAEEFLEENRENTGPWRDRPHRMLKHKAMKEAIRYGFGITGIQDIREAEEAAQNQANTSRQPDTTPDQGDAQPANAGLKEPGTEVFGTAPDDRDEGDEPEQEDSDEWPIEQVLKDMDLGKRTSEVVREHFPICETCEDVRNILRQTGEAALLELDGVGQATVKELRNAFDWREEPEPQGDASEAANVSDIDTEVLMDASDVPATGEPYAIPGDWRQPDERPEFRLAAVLHYADQNGAKMGLWRHKEDTDLYWCPAHGDQRSDHCEHLKAARDEIRETVSQHAE